MVTQTEPKKTVEEEIQVNNKSDKEHQQVKTNKVEHIPITVSIANGVQQQPLMNCPFLCLLDSGATVGEEPQKNWVLWAS